MRTWVSVAVLAKSKSLDGRFVAKAAAGLPFLLVEDDIVHLVPPQLDTPRTARVLEVKEIDDRSAVVRLEGVETPDVAARMVGMHCLIRADEIDDEAFEEPCSLWEGWRVLDEELGSIGTVVSIIDNPGQALIEVERAEGNVLVPAVDEIVVDVDHVSQTLHVRLPKGLLDL